MTRHRIAQIGENRNPKSPENRPQTRRFLQIRLLQLRRSATPFNGLAVLHGRLNTDPNFPKPSGPRLLEDFRVMLSTRRVSAIVSAVPSQGSGASAALSFRLTASLEGGRPLDCIYPLFDPRQSAPSGSILTLGTRV